MTSPPFKSGPAGAGAEIAAAALGPAQDAARARAAAPTGERLIPLDGLRGLLAIGVMLYHFTVWTGSTPIWGPARAVVQAVGLTFVDAFFVVSGASLVVASRGADWRRPRTLAAFAVRRVFRIYPLYWLATLAAATLALASQDVPPAALSRLVAANLTLAFGFLDASRALPVGGWSLALEMVFYVAFPLLALAGRRSAGRFAVVATATALLVVGSLALEGDGSLVGQWRAYVRPWNHLAFFVAGMALGWWRPALPGAAALALAASLFVGLAALCPSPDGMALLAPLPRLGFLAVTTLAVASAVTRTTGSAGLDGIAEGLGRASYATYILHPLLFELNARAGLLPVPALAVLTPALALAVHAGLERPLIRRSQRLAARIGPRRDEALPNPL